MNSPLITTKLFIPPTRPDVLSRSRLLHKIDEGAEYPILLISAPAGSGKSTLISEWAGKANHPVAWISLESEDNEPAQFLSYLISALKSIHKDVSDETLDTLLSSQADSFELVVTNLINELAAIPGDFTVIFDDFHTITDPRLNHLVTFLIDHQPSQMHLVFATRIDPAWPIPRYRARNLIYEIRGQDLQFTLQEATEFLSDSMGLKLPANQIAALDKRTEGWAAGLQLAAVSLQGQQDIPGFIEEFTGSHIYIAEYLLEEILKNQTEEIEDFLIQTSILDRLNGELCESVTGCPEGQAALNYLYKANLFIVPLDTEGNWFRYHHLFSDLLRSLLKQKCSQYEISALHTRAASWYEKNNYIPEAVNHIIAAEDFTKASALIEEAAHPLIFDGRINILRNWLESLPKSSVNDHPSLAFYSFWIDLLQGKADLSPQSIQKMEILLETLPVSPNNDRIRGELTAVICRALALSGRTAQAIKFAHSGLNFLADDDQASRARLYSGLAIALDIDGRWDEALPYYKKSHTSAIAAGDYLLAVNTVMAKGLAQYYYGQLQNAAGIFQSVIDMKDPEKSTAPVQNSGGQVADIAMTAVNLSGPGYIGLGQIQLEWNDLHNAEKNIRKGLELCRLGGQDGLFLGRLNLSRLHQANGNLEKALEEIDFPIQAHKDLNVYRIISRQIKINLASGDASKAVKLAAPFIKIITETSPGEQTPILFYELIQAAVARVYIAREEFDKALNLLDNLQSSAENTNRIGRMIEVHLLRSLVQQQESGPDSSEAINSLHQALFLAVEPGFIMLFLEEGSVLIPLLQQVTDDADTADQIKTYAEQILEAFSKRTQMPGLISKPSPEQITEQLTPREMEVLQLLAAGNSNKEIADKLVITVRTVKKHTSNIYGKLRVSNRTQAVVHAQQIGLLSSD